MDANGRELILKEEIYALISCAFEIINGLSHGLHEKPYENSLAVEFRHRGIPFIQQPKFPVLWRNVMVGEFIPDLIAYQQIIADTKWTDAQLPPHHAPARRAHPQFQKTKTRMGAYCPIYLNSSASRPFAFIRG